MIVDVNPGGDMHGRDQHHPFLHSALPHGGFDLRRDVNVFPVPFRVKGQIFYSVWNRITLLTCLGKSKLGLRGEQERNYFRSTINTERDGFMQRKAPRYRKIVRPACSINGYAL